jgi:Vacuolar protein sorting 55
MAAGLKTIIALSFVHGRFNPYVMIISNCSQVLAIGFLLVILSSALFHSYLPLLVVATYVIAPLPNWICGRCANPDDFMENAGNALIDFGRFCTGFLVVMGIGMLHIIQSWIRVLVCEQEPKADMFHAALPALLAHCHLIQVPAMVMSIIGGLLIYGTIISFTMFFQEEQDF